MYTDLVRQSFEGTPSRCLPLRARRWLEPYAMRGFGLTGGMDQITLRSEPAQATIAAAGDISLAAVGVGEIEAATYQMKAVLGAADLATANLECVLTSRTAQVGILGSFLRGLPEAVAVIAGSGLDVVTCANNHCLDFGAGALQESIGVVRGAGVEVCGVGDTPLEARRPVVRSANGVRIGILAYADDWRPQVMAGAEPAAAFEADIVEDIAGLRGRVDVVVVHLHWGWEWIIHPLLSHRNAARRIAEAGADVVLCHHAHVPMAVEAWNASIIAHGLGNFFFPPRRATGSLPPHPWRDRSFVLRIGVSDRGVHSARVVPTEQAAGTVKVSGGLRRREMLGGLSALAASLVDDHRLARIERERVVGEGLAVARGLRKFVIDGQEERLEERIRYLRTPRSRGLIRALAEGGVGEGAVALARIFEEGSAAGSEAVSAAVRDGRLVTAIDWFASSGQLPRRPLGRVP